MKKTKKDSVSHASHEVIVTETTLRQRVKASRTSVAVIEGVPHVISGKPPVVDSIIATKGPPKLLAELYSHGPGHLTTERKGKRRSRQ